MSPSAELRQEGVIEIGIGGGHAEVELLIALVQVGGKFGDEGAITGLRLLGEAFDVER